MSAGAARVNGERGTAWRDLDRGASVSRAERRLGPPFLFVAILVALATSGCTSDLCFRDAETTSPYAGLLARDRALRSRDVRVVADPGSDPPLTLALREVRSPSNAGGPVLVLQPGLFSDRRAWRFVTGPLGERYDLLLVDPPGTGASGIPDPASAPDAYTPTWLAASTLGALRAWQRTLPAPRRLILVGHSLGGAVVLRILGDADLRARFADVTPHVTAAVLLAPADPSAEAGNANLRQVAEIPEVLIGFAATTGILRRKVSEAVHGSVVDPSLCALRQERDRILEAVCNPAKLRATRATIRRFVTPGAYGRPDGIDGRRLQARLASIEVPCLLLWGDEDKTYPVSLGREFRDGIPNARLEVLEEAGHSAQLDRPHRVSAEILRFVESLESAGPPASP